MHQENYMLKRRREHYKQLLLENNILKYFNIENNKIKITLKKYNNNSDIVKINYKTDQNYIDIIKLPKEINDIINSYLEASLNIKYKIYYPKRYPYEQPKWKLYKINYNIKMINKMNLKKYFKYIANNHNKSYINTWSTAYTIDKDLLNFITRLHIFDYINEYINKELIIID